MIASEIICSIVPEAKPQMLKKCIINENDLAATTKAAFTELK